MGDVRPEFRQKKTDGASGGFLPRPLLLRLRNPKLAEVLRKPYSQKIASAKPSPFVSPHQDFVRNRFGLC